MKNSVKSDKTKIVVWCVFIFLIVYTVSIILLLVWGFSTSLKSNKDFLTFGNKVWLPNPEYSASELKFSNYWKIIQNFEMRVSANYWSGNTQIIESLIYGFPGLIVNTIIYALGGAIISTLVPCISAYFCAKYRYKFSRLVYTVVIVVMMIPIVGNYPSELTFLRNIGLYDSFLGNFIQKFNFTGMYFLVFYAFFQGLSDAYSEAAEIDGASQMHILLGIALPLASKIIGTVLLILFIEYWNDYQTPLLYLPTHPTLAYGVYRLVNESGSSKNFNDVPTKVAGCMLLALPILIIFIVLRDKLMGNISIGGEKE